MKRWLVILSMLLCFVFPESGSSRQVMMISGGGGGNGASENCGDFLICQNLEGAGYDNSENWTDSGSTEPDEDYTTAPAPLRGSQSLYCLDTSTDCRATSPSFAASNPFYGHFIIRPVNLPGTFAQLMACGNFALYIDNDPAKSIRVLHGSVYAGNTSTVLDTGVTHHIWFEYIADTGGGGDDGVSRVWISTDETKPGSPEINVSNGDLESTITECYFIAQDSNNWIIDQIYFDSDQIGSVAP